MLDYYKLLLGDVPSFLNKYLRVPTLIRLKKIGYFCGMDYASKDVYNFSCKITRYEHSLTVALLTYKLTKDKKQTIAALFHDISAPCFSHVIDYMNGDYANQESTENLTKIILEKDLDLLKCLNKDNLNLEDIDFKKYSIVDIDRPGLCADRLDGIILTSIGWTCNINKKTIKNILDDICIIKNESNKDEIGFKNMSIAKKVLKINEKIDEYTHSKEDNYMMELLATITKKAIENRTITYESLYYEVEDNLFAKLKSDKSLNDLINKFQNIRREDIPIINMPYVKKRNINPLVNGKRLI